MALILAIEPDKRQASQLMAMVRGRLRADFVLGETAERALAALGERVPDLILTSALLSPKDETALGERLRSLNGAAAHVHTLTIPVLSAPLGRPRSVARVGGMLSAFLSDRSKNPASSPEGCDPAVFADQCREYLDRAAVERSALLEDAVADAGPAAPAAQAAAFEDVAVAPDADPVLREFFDPDESDAPLSLMAAVAALAEEERAEPASPSLDENQIGEPDVPVELELSAAPDDRAGIAALVEEEAALDAGVDVYQIDDPSVAAEAAGEPARETRSADTGDLPGTPRETELYTSRSRADVKCWPVLEEFVAEAQALAEAQHVDEGVDRGRTPAEAPTPSAESVDLKEWTDIIETLRREAAQVPVEPMTVPAPSAWTPVETAATVPGTGPDGDAAATGRKRKRRFYPVQDEWGFFDPDQAGFAALIAKLEEITEQDDPAIPRPS